MENPTKMDDLEVSWGIPILGNPLENSTNPTMLRHLASSPARLDPRHPAAAHPRRCKGGWSYPRRWDQTLLAFCIAGSRDGARNEYGAFATKPSAEEFEGLWHETKNEKGSIHIAKSSIKLTNIGVYDSESSYISHRHSRHSTLLYITQPCGCHCPAITPVTLRNAKRRRCSSFRRSERLEQRRPWWKPLWSSGSPGPSEADEMLDGFDASLGKLHAPICPITGIRNWCYNEFLPTLHQDQPSFKTRNTKRRGNGPAFAS